MEEFGWTWTTPANEVSGTGCVGNLATVARWPARPSAIEAGELSTLVGVEVAMGGGLVMEGLAADEFCCAM